MDRMVEKVARVADCGGILIGWRNVGRRFRYIVTPPHPLQAYDAFVKEQGNNIQRAKLLFEVLEEVRASKSTTKKIFK